MGSLMTDSVVPRLERSCTLTGWIRTAPSCAGLQRVEAYFAGHGFESHRHDTYAIGFTMHGVQSFRANRTSNIMPFSGQVFGSHEMLCLPAGQVTTRRSQSTKN